MWIKKGVMSIQEKAEKIGSFDEINAFLPQGEEYLKKSR